MTWRTLPTHSRISLVKEHWCSGYSASDIARSISARLGETISRNVICGIYDRHRDALVNHPLQVPKQLARARNPASRRKRVAKPVRMPTAPQQARFVPLLDLRANECRWPVNDARVGEMHLFCGCGTDVNSSWCEFHAELVFGEGTKSEQEAVKMARVAA